MRPLHDTPFRSRPEAPEPPGPLATVVRAARVGAVAGAGAVALLLAAQGFLHWHPPFDAAWLVGPAFLAPLLAVREALQARRRGGGRSSRYNGGSTDE